MESIKVRFNGLSPTIPHNGRLANPLDNYAKRIKEITSKRKKTDEDHAAIMRLEWEGGLYWDKEIGPYWPGINIDSLICKAAKSQKRGQDVKRGLQVVEDKVPLLYKGPRDDFDKMFELYRDVRAVKVGAATVMRCRPIFPEWSVEFTIVFDPEVFNRNDVLGFLVYAGRYVGLSDNRPRYGKFEVEEIG